MTYNISEQFGHLSPIKQALLAIEVLQSKVGGMERERHEPIAIIGMGCRFPGGDGTAAFWQLLRNGVDAVTEMPADRWDGDAYYDSDPEALGKMYTRYGSFLSSEQALGFEPQFFGISPREAMAMDPQQRLLLEVSWEALEDAGQAPDKIATRTGVFVGIGQNDYSQLPHINPHDYTQLGPYDGSGNLFCFASGRLSYILGLQGPNMAIDTACSSSLVAVHLACQSLRAGECEMALAGGVHLILSPKSTIGLSRMRALSPDGRCKTFSAQADGYGRGEGCGMIILKRLSDAQANGDNILAVIRGSAVNHDGASSGLTVPNKQAQEALIRQALETAQVMPDEVSYVEAHGTGTSLGDPLEVRALASVLGGGNHRRGTPSRLPSRQGLPLRGGNREGLPLLIGSVKTNIGHLEAAAGIAGLIKVVLSLQHGEIPPHLHCHELNPLLNWDELPVKVPTERVVWEGQGRVAGVSSFGLSGTNAHVILEAPPVGASLALAPLAPKAARAALLMLSAKSEEALEALVGRYITYFEDASLLNPPLPLLGREAVFVSEGLGVRADHWPNICFTAHVGRSHFKHRLALIAESVDEAKTILLKNKNSAQSVLYLDPPPAQSMLDLAERYIRGEEIKESELWADPPLPLLGREAVFVSEGLGVRAQRVPLPTYPWQRERYWPEPSAPIARVGEHPLLGRKVSSPLLKEILFESHLHLKTNPFLGDHRVYFEVVVSGPTRLAMVLEAATLAFGAGRYTFSEVYFPQALVVPENEGCSIQLVITPSSTRGAALGSTNYQFVKRLAPDKPAASGTGAPDKLAACGTGAPDKPAASGTFSFQMIMLEKDGFRVTAVGQIIRHDLESSFPVPIVLSDLQARCTETMSSTDLYDALWQNQIQLGPDYRWIDSIWRGQREALAKIIVPQKPGGGNDYQLHPCLLDSCFQLMGAVFGESEDVILPFRVGDFHFYRMPNGVSRPMWCYVRQIDDTKVDIHLFEPDGKLIAEVIGFEGRRASREALLLRDGRGLSAERAKMLYQIEWRHKPNQPRQAAPHPVPRAQVAQAASLSGGAVFGESEEVILPSQGEGVWLIFADEGGIGQHLAALLAERGAQAELVMPSQLNPTNGQAFASLLKEKLSERSEAPYRGVIHLWGINTTESILSQAAGCGSALHLVQAMGDSSPEGLGMTKGISPQLWLVTQRAQAIEGRLVQPEQAALWGLGGVIALEHPEFNTMRLDLGEGTPNELAQLLFKEIEQSTRRAEALTTSNQVAYHEGQRYVARLVGASARLAPTGDGLAEGAISDSASYLITGGLGALGLQAASYLVKEGARHLVLTSRRGISSPEQAQAVEALEAAGAVVEVVKADVSKLADMENVLAQIHLSSEVGKYPLRGVIHAAGLLDDGILMEQSIARFEKVMAPKIQGAWNLHLLTRPHPNPLPEGEGEALDFFVMFSSAASLLGSPGQGNYAAANAFMDGLAHYRASQGLPALSINWGPWAEGMTVGATLALAHQQRRIAGQGILPIEPAEGWRIFHELLNQKLSTPQIGVLNINWAQFRQQFASLPPLFAELEMPLTPEPLTSRLSQGRAGASPAPTGDRLAGLLEAAPDEREALLTTYLQEQVARALGLRVERLDNEQPLNMMGIDSLTALDVRNQIKSDLDIDVPVVKFLEGLNLLQLISSLNEQLAVHGGIEREASQADKSPESLLELMEDGQYGDDMLGELDELAEEDIDALLMAMMDSP